jgi:hypothetical protein
VSSSRWWERVMLSHLSPTAAALLALAAVLRVLAHADGSPVQLRVVQHADRLRGVARVVELHHAAVTPQTHPETPPSPPPPLR